jgi:hypothetical protein
MVEACRSTRTTAVHVSTDYNVVISVLIVDARTQCAGPSPRTLTPIRSLPSFVFGSSTEQTFSLVQHLYHTGKMTEI